jgi:uncharacterized Zn-binding protein involved in type VI secretion
MPGQARVSDIGDCPSDAHGCPSCPHPSKGRVIVGSADVFVNKLPAARVDDTGTHSSCCGPNTFTCTAGSGTVFINGKKAHRKGDKTTHCGGSGSMSSGSADVITGG